MTSNAYHDEHDGAGHDTAPAELDVALVETVRGRLASAKPIRRTLVGGGRLHIDRPLPFLCVYRSPADRDDRGTADLVRTQASFLIAPADYQRSAGLVEAVVEMLTEACGACLLLEVWSSEPTSGTPTFRIRTASEDRLATTIDALGEALRAMALPVPIEVEVVSAGQSAPAGQPALIPPALAARDGILSIGLEVPAVYRSATGIYPLVLRKLTHELMHALQLGFFEFTRVQTAARPEHFQMMGRRRMVRAVREADAALAELAESFDFLLAVTPVNTEAAWTEFNASSRRVMPRLHYRMLTVDPEQAKRRLYDLPLDRLEDPVIAQLLRDKRRELDRQLGLLEDRDTPRFMYGSLQLYEPVDDALLAEALAILGSTAPSTPAPKGATGRCDATMLAARAQIEVDHYRALLPSLPTTIHIRDDVSSLIVSHGDLLIPRRLDVAPHRVEALLQHEIGTHVVTFANGSAQPLQILAGGLAGYEALQEGLAMFAEHLVGGLDSDRLRLVAARVIAVRRLVEGVSFPEVAEELTDQHRLSPRSAFNICVRVFRGGGLTKDAIYLRGVLQLLEHLHDGHEITPLLVGKVAVAQVDLIEELLRREILHPPALQPRWLASPTAAARLERARRGIRPVDLVETQGAP